MWPLWLGHTPAWARSLATGVPLPAFVGTSPFPLQGLPIPLPSPEQWMRFTPVEQQAILQLAQMTMGDPATFLRFMQASWPSWSPVGFVPFTPVLRGGMWGPFAI